MESRKGEAVRRILLEKYPDYYRLAFSYVHQEADAMDIVQEGAYRAMLHADSLCEEAYAGTWIYRIMINVAKEYLKKYKKEHQELQEEYMPAEAGYGTYGDEGGYSDMELKEAVDKLPLQEKTIIILRFYEDKPLSEIAEILEENLSTVKSRLYRTLEKLRKELC